MRERSLPDLKVPFMPAMFIDYMRITLGYMIVLMSLAFVMAARAQETSTAPSHLTTAQHRKGRPATTTPAGEAEETSTEPVLSEHELLLPQIHRTLKYSATAGFIPLHDDKGKLRANVFFVAYELADQKLATRPITFVFNGGPGAASVWLHLGTAGPKRVAVPEDGSIPAPPYHLEDNPYTWLDFTDLVFIDPVGTGYSRAEGDHAKEFYSVQGDVESVADVIRIYLTQHQRWASPKFVAGESYGTTRAAGLSEYLHDRFGIDASGIVLISTVLNFQTLQFAEGNDTPYPLWLPSYTAAAWYHKKLPADLQNRPLTQVVAEAQQWALNQYMPALLKGYSLDDAARSNIATQLSRYTGLPLDYVTRAHLRVEPQRFEKSLLANQQRMIGRMDARISAPDADPLNDSPEFDPSLTGYVGVFSNCFNDYIRDQLMFENNQPYEFLSPNVGPWDWGRGSGYLNVSTTLRRAMLKVPTMKLMICSGWFDLATPFTATDYTVNQMPLGPMRANVVQHYYEGGHMLYLNHPSLEKLHEDLKSFVQSALPPATQPAS
jgi:carboxypeptidase C (cathepsin A)